MALSSHACWGQMLHDLPSPMAGAAPLMPTIRANQSPAQAPNVELRSDSLVSNIDVNDSSNLLIGAVKVDGAPQIEPAAFMHVVMPYIGHQLDRQQLQAMLNAISNVARGRGYVLARAAIPGQAIRAGVLTVALDMGRIDRVELHGEQSNAVRALLARLVGKPARQADLERQLMLAADIPGVSVSDVRFAHDGDLGVLIADVGHKAVALRVDIDNRGTREVGPIRMTLGYDLNGVLGDERLSFSGQIQTTPQNPTQLYSTLARIAYVVDNSGTEVTLSGSISHTHPGGVLAGFDFAGVVREFQLGLNHPLYRSRRTSIWLGTNIAYVALDQSLAGYSLWQDRALVAGVTVNGFAPLAGGQLRGGWGLSRLLKVPGMTQVGDPLSSRPGAGAGASIFTANANWEGPLVGPVSARLAFSGQLADAPLPIAQQISIGGPDFGRAYDYSERSGDEGALGSIELKYKLHGMAAGPIELSELYGFGDVGYLTNLDSSLGAGSLYSAGFGGRFVVLRKMKMGLEVAFPLNQPRYETGTYAPRVSASMGASF